jgi:hypothetical protein
MQEITSSIGALASADHSSAITAGSELNGGSNSSNIIAESSKPSAASPKKPSKTIPLDVRIDVKGAYIISSDESSASSQSGDSGAAVTVVPDVVDLEELEDAEDYQHDSNDIRLPRNRSVVSHMAVDVRYTHKHWAKKGKLTFCCRLEEV